MRKNRKIKRNKSSWTWVLSFIFLAIFAYGLYFAYSQLRALWLEQCIVTDVSKQVTVSTGNYIKANTILDCLNIRNGINLAEIDLNEKHKSTLKKIPNIRSLIIQRHLPNRLEIFVEEREPVARVTTQGSKKWNGRVVDRDGVVFLRQKDVAILPIIEEPRANQTNSGEKLVGLARAALSVIMALQTDELHDFTILAIDSSKKDYLVATLSNYSQAKISWDKMFDEPEDLCPSLLQQLKCLRNAIKTCGNGVKVWNATRPNRITGDTKEPIL